jgi:hypothetical protein
VELLWSATISVGYSLRKNFWIDTLARRPHTTPAFNDTVLTLFAKLTRDAADAIVCRWFDTDMPVVESLVTTVASQISGAPCRTVRCGIGKAI